jgi:carbonic anhydrase/SulP family sulfate permease
MSKEQPKEQPNEQGNSRLQSLFKDLLAGLVVFFIAVPLCLGIANASKAEGIAPEQNATILSGIIAGIIGGIVVGLLSNSPISVSGPAAGLTAVVSMQIANVGSFQGFLVAVFLAGLIQLVLGYFQMGSLARFFPTSVIKGLLTAIGIILILKQFPHLVGQDKDPIGDLAFFQSESGNTISDLYSVVEKFHKGAAIIGLSSLVLLLVWDRIRFLRKSIVPSALVVVLWGVGLNLLFREWGEGFRLGNDHEVKLPQPDSISNFFQQFARPDFTVLIQPSVYIAAFVIAMVASLETLLNVEAVDQIDPKKRRTNLNRELVAQGVGNSLCGLIGGLPITSVIVRSSANINAGAESKISTIVHGFMLLFAVAFLPYYMNMIPLAALAAILLITGYKLASVQLFRQMWSQGYQRFVPFVVTVVAIVFTDLLIGILIGLGITLIFIIYSNLRRPVRVIKESHISGEVTRIELANQVSFLNKASLSRQLDEIPDGGHVLLDARATDYIDPDVLDLLREFKNTVGPARKIEVSQLGFLDEYNMEDRVLYVDYTTREIQEKITPKEVLRILQQGNDRFRSGQRLHRDVGKGFFATAKGQYPIAAVLSCMDSRTPAEIIFDAGVGDLFSIRIAGNVARDKVLGSLEYATAVAKSKLILVLGHTSCGAVNAAIDIYNQGKTASEVTGCEHLDVLMNEIKRAIPHVKPEADPATGYEFADRVACENVRNTIQKIRTESNTISRLEKEGNIAIVGGLYDIRTGTVDFFVLPEGWETPEANTVEMNEK